jgi:uncharacterized damage-inducible protein DinB
MLLLIVRDLIEHKNYGNAMLLNAIMAHEQASADKELRNLLHHIILANRFWLSLLLDESFDVNGDSHPPRSLEDVAALYRQTHDRELEWMSRINDSDFERTPVTPFIPDRTFSLVEAAVQVCLHSHGHRAQCATRLRALGGKPPPLDFTLSLKDRPRAEWSQAG